MTATNLELSSSDRSAMTLAARKTRVDPPHGLGAAVDLPSDPLPSGDEALRGPGVEDDLAEPVFPEECRAAATEAGALREEGPLALEVEEPTDAMLTAVAGAHLEAQRQQLQLHVAQLAEHLQARLRDVDRRESLLSAREAQLEAELRAARLWHQERQQELGERERAWTTERQELCAQIEELTRQLSLLRAAQESQQPAAWAAKQAELAAWEAELDRRQQELDEAGAASLQTAQAATHRLEEHWQTLAGQQAALQTALSLLEEHRQQLGQQHANLTREQQAWHAFEEQQRERRTRQEQEAAAELARQRTHLTQWQAALERQAAGLHRLREELLQLHRQALEARLAAEQLAADVGKQASPAAWAQVQAEIRQQLAAQYLLEEESLAARRQELLTLSKRLAARHEELCQLRAALREWLAERQRELQQQAAALAAHEEALAARWQQLLVEREAALAQHQTLQQKLQTLVRPFLQVPDGGAGGPDPKGGVEEQTRGVEGAAWPQ